MGRISIETGRRIRMYRAQQHLSQEELAEKCGMHPTYIGQLERGEKNATLESISKVRLVCLYPLVSYLRILKISTALEQTIRLRHTG